MNQLKLLVVIANYGVKNDCYLQRLLEEYRSLPYQVHVVVLTNVSKKLTDVELIVTQPTGHPWTFPFAHKAVMAERVEHFDLFLYSEDDTLITHKNIAAFLAATNVLADDEIAGFLRVESANDGTQTISTINSHFHWDPASVVKRGDDVFAYFTNEHSASYILTRQQLRKAIASGGFLVEPHQEKYDLLVTAATDPYTQCGFKKLICVSHLDDFLLTHLPNKYVDQMGLRTDEASHQITALQDIARGKRQPVSLLRTETKMRHLLWSKHFYEAPRTDLIAALPPDAKNVLSYGCGTGELEAALSKAGLQVTAVPLDSVIGACVEARGIEVVYGEAETSLRALHGRSFDAVLLLGILHLNPHPPYLLQMLRQLLSNRGVIIATVPNIASLRVTWRRLRDKEANVTRTYENSGVHAASYDQIHSWFLNSGFKIKRIESSGTDNTHWYDEVGDRLAPRWLAREFVVQGYPQNV